MGQDLYIENREKITITEVVGVDEFDETAIFVKLKEESLVIYGRNLHIETLDLDEGRLSAAGRVESLTYTRRKEKKNLLERLKK